MPRKDRYKPRPDDAFSVGYDNNRPFAFTLDDFEPPEEMYIRENGVLVKYCRDEYGAWRLKPEQP